MTEHEKELLAQQAELMGFPDTARTVRVYLSTSTTTRQDVIRTHELASAFGWTRLPGWRAICPHWKAPKRGVCQS